MNMKRILMELGNRLVLERGFAPSVEWDDHGQESTLPIKRFTDWLNGCTSARELLADMGVEWPTVIAQTGPMPGGPPVASRQVTGDRLVEVIRAGLQVFADRDAIVLSPEQIDERTNNIVKALVGIFNISPKES